MSTLKWLIGVLFQLLRHNVGQGVEIKTSEGWKSGIILKIGSDYAVFMIDKKEVFIPLSAIQGIKLTEI